MGAAEASIHYQPRDFTPSNSKSRIAAVVAKKYRRAASEARFRGLGGGPLIRFYCTQVRQIFG